MASDTDVSVNGFQDAADRDGGILLGSQKDMGSHGSRGSLSVGAGYCDRGFVVCHKLSEKL